jgi:hypothetical protein
VGAGAIGVLAGDLLGIEVPDTRPVFLAVLGVHVVTGVAAVVAGLFAALARKRAGRHPRAGRMYLVALGVVAVTVAGLAVLRWPHDVHLLVLGVTALALGVGGYAARRRRRPGWARRHIVGMGGSYVVLLTAFYVDNGPQLPLWQLLPTWALWVLPAGVGAPVIAAALRRHRALGRVTPAGRGSAGSAATPTPPEGGPADPSGRYRSAAPRRSRTRAAGRRRPSRAATRPDGP